MKPVREAWAWARKRLRWRDVVIVALIGASILFTVTYVRSTEREFCQVITAATQPPAAKPSDPAANPSRVQAYEWYLRFAALGRSLGC